MMVAARAILPNYTASHSIKHGFEAYVTHVMISKIFINPAFYFVV